MASGSLSLPAILSIPLWQQPPQRKIRGMRLRIWLTTLSSPDPRVASPVLSQTVSPSTLFYSTPALFLSFSSPPFPPSPLSWPMPQLSTWSTHMQIISPQSMLSSSPLTTTVSSTLCMYLHHCVLLSTVSLVLKQGITDDSGERIPVTRGYLVKMPPSLT